MILTKSSELSDALRLLARAAGDLIMTYYDRPIVARAKPDSSPVTDADEAAERLIVEGLRSLAPDIPIVAEELFTAGQSPEVGEEPFWLVDPLDGTKEFIGRNGEFTVNIALIVARKPVLGVIYAPARDETFTGLPAPGRPARARAEHRRRFRFARCRRTA